MGKLYLIGIDIQNDFCPGGLLAVPNGNEVIAPWNKLTENLPRATKIFSMDYHPQITNHFLEHGGQWPTHCVMGTKGAELHQDLKVADNDVVVVKGTGKDEPGYSAFEAIKKACAIYPTDKIIIGGLATDYCVRATALDFAHLGYQVALVTNAIRAVNLQLTDGENALREMQLAGVTLTTTDKVLKEFNKSWNQPSLT